MTTRTRNALPAATAALVLVGVGHAAPPSNVCSGSKHAWGENIGWLNFRDAEGGSAGVYVHPTHATGWVWGENVGWIRMGSGKGPYPNTSGVNFGVNINPVNGICSGYAWGENIGWINFGTHPFVAPLGARFDFASRRFTGYAWGENVGWINLDVANFGKHVRAVPADTNADGAVNFTDLNAVLGQFGQSGSGLTADVTGDNRVNFSDLNAVLAFFGQTCTS